MNWKPFLVTIISAVCLTLGEKETGGEKGGNAGKLFSDFGFN